MASAVIRILSDLHYGDRASRIPNLASLRPLFEGVNSLVLNGDTIDTRPAANPADTARLRAETRLFFERSAPPTRFLTGNHDPDISTEHHLDLADGKIFVTHGDIIFDNLVPWGQDARLIGQRIATQLGALSPEEREQLDPRLRVHRAVASSIPQRHQSEKNPVKYTLGFLADTVWPPLRILQVLKAWRQAPELTSKLVGKYRSTARFAIIGHIHHLGHWRTSNGMVVVSTGSFCPPRGAAFVDIDEQQITLRSIELRRGEFHPGTTRAVFPLHP